MKRFIFLMIIIFFQNCLKEYPDSYTCEGFIRLYYFGDTYLEMTGREPAIQGNQNTTDTILLTCLRAHQLRKADPPKFYEDPEPW
jgi:hypothetical protein